MDGKKAVKKRLSIFIALTFAVTWAVFLFIPLSGQAYGEGDTTIVIMAAMFVPAICSVLTRLMTREGFRNMYLRPNFRGHVKDYALVYVGPAILILLCGAVFFLIFPGWLDRGLTALGSMAALSGTGLSALGLLLLSVLQVLIIGPVINIIPTMGEELGWRGYLLPKLRELLPDTGAMIATGAIWGIWHAPIIAMGHNYGTQYPGYPWLGILSMIVFCIILGTVEGYASIKLESAVPAAMIHSTINAGAALPILLVKSGYNPVLGPTVAGLAGGIPLIALAAILLIKSGKKPDK